MAPRRSPWIIAAAAVILLGPSTAVGLIVSYNRHADLRVKGPTPREGVSLAVDLRPHKQIALEPSRFTSPPSEPGRAPPGNGGCTEVLNAWLSRGHSHVAGVGLLTFTVRANSTIQIDVPKITIRKLSETQLSDVADYASCGTSDRRDMYEPTASDYLEADRLPKDFRVGTSRVHLTEGLVGLSSDRQEVRFAATPLQEEIDYILLEPHQPAAFPVSVVGFSDIEPGHGAFPSNGTVATFQVDVEIKVNGVTKRATFPGGGKHFTLYPGTRYYTDTTGITHFEWLQDTTTWVTGRTTSTLPPPPGPTTGDCRLVTVPEVMSLLLIGWAQIRVYVHQTSCEWHGAGKSVYASVSSSESEAAAGEILAHLRLAGHGEAFAMPGTDDAQHFSGNAGGGRQHTIYLRKGKEILDVRILASVGDSDRLTDERARRFAETVARRLWGPQG